jgi:hypothetical protein
MFHFTTVGVDFVFLLLLSEDTGTMTASRPRRFVLRLTTKLFGAFYFGVDTLAFLGRILFVRIKLRSVHPFSHFV